MSELPKFHEYLGPILDVLDDGVERTSRDIVQLVAGQLKIPQAQREETVPSGERRLNNRVFWGITYLKQAGCLARPKRAVYAITDRGRTLRAAHPGGVTLEHLEQFPEYQEFKQRTGSKTAGVSAATTPATLTPVEQIASAVDEIESAVAQDLIDRIRSMPPEFMEKAVLRLLVAMGYGGSDGDAQHIGGTGDGGFDGVINQDRLGLERVYVQAKRYAADNIVGRPAVQGFVGALHGVGAAGGVFITTSRFSAEAVAFAESIKPRVILIDGARLGALMVAHSVGVQEMQQFRVVQVDEDFFE
jgi:restriction system protein